MSKIQTVCWGLLAVIGVGSIEPAVMAATSTEKPKVAQSVPTVTPVKPVTPPKPVTPTTTPVAPAAVVAPLTPPATADVTLVNVFNGNVVPTTIKLRDLTPVWRAMGTNGPVEFGNLQAVITTSAGGSFAASYYSRGQTITIGSETYIVAYSLLSLVDKITPETPLNLSLLNLRTVGSLSNIRTYDVAKETKILEKQLAIIKLANVFDPTAGTPDEKPPIEAVPVPDTTKPAPKKPVKKKRTTTRKRSR
jgi:hypothetical protein